jgi:HlyD family secretion protein
MFRADMSTKKERALYSKHPANSSCAATRACSAVFAKHWSNPLFPPFPASCTQIPLPYTDQRVALSNRNWHAGCYVVCKLRAYANTANATHRRLANLLRARRVLTKQRDGSESRAKTQGANVNELQSISLSDTPGKLAGIPDTSGQDIRLAPPSQRRRLLIAGGIGAAALLVLGLLAPIVNNWLLAEVSIPRERLRVATVKHGDLVRDVSVEGRVVAAVSPTLFASADGTITLLAESGKEVTVGEELARIASPELESRLQQERSTLETAGVELERERIAMRQLQLESQKNADLAGVALTAAQRELRRNEQAYATRAIAEVDLQKAQDEVHNAELAHNHAIKDMELDTERLNFELRTRELGVDRQALLVADLERQVEELTLRSPVIGIVGNLQVDQKAAVANNQPVMTVVDLTAFEVEANVPESYADDLGLGMPAEIHIGAASYEATVIAVSPEIVQNQVTTRLRFTGTPPGLRQNQRLTTRILLENKPNVLMVERGQFLESGAGRLAYVLDGDIARRTDIELGARSLNAVEVLGGLNAGDVIISSSYDSFERAETVLVTD